MSLCPECNATETTVLRHREGRVRRSTTLRCTGCGHVWARWETRDADPRKPKGRP